MKPIILYHNQSHVAIMAHLIKDVGATVLLIGDHNKVPAIPVRNIEPSFNRNTY